MNKLITDIISSDEFYEIIKGETKPVVVAFKASWCTPCKILSTVLYEFKKEVGERIKIITVDIDENEKLIEKLSIRSVPTVSVYYGGELKEKTVGLTTKAQLSYMVVKYI